MKKWIFEFSGFSRDFVDSLCTQEDDPRNDMKPNQKTSVKSFQKHYTSVSVQLWIARTGTSHIRETALSKEDFGSV